MSLLELRGLCMAIGGAEILRDVSLTLARGKVLGLIGESGSGKSMTALSVMRLEPRGAVLSGSVRFAGQDLLAMEERRLCDLRGGDIGMIFQEPMTALNPAQTIGAQVAEGIMLHKGLSRGQAMQAAREVLRKVELPEAEFPLHRYPHQLSGGQRQRVVIALAIASEPDLLIADEPTTALDVTTQAEILALIRRLVAEEGIAVLFISHDLAVVADMADEIAIMRRGEIVERGAARAVLERPEHGYTQALLEASTHVPERAQAQARAPLLEVSDLRCTYPGPRSHLLARPSEKIAVDSVSFTLQEGESLGLVGESGCGKSTLARAILGLQEGRSGQIRLNGEEIPAKGPVPAHLRKEMQVVFQDPFGSFNPRHKVARLVTEPFHLLAEPPRGRARAEAAAEALEAVGLSAKDGQKYIHEFSGGQRQRIAIARALITRPKLILLDEAVSALDVSIRAQILDLLADLAGRFGLSYLFISHDLHVVRSVTDRVLVMRRGEIVEAGPTEEVLRRPTHPYTHSLLQATPELARPAEG